MSALECPGRRCRRRVVSGSSAGPLPPPPEEAAPRGRLHSRSRDAQAVQHHYDVSNDFYAMVLGPAMTYSCARFAPGVETLEAAQESKHDLVCRKLGLAERAGSAHPRRRVRLGQLRHPCGPPLRRPGRRGHAQPGAGRGGPATGSLQPDWRSRSRSGCRTTGTCGTARSTASHLSACSSTSGSSQECRVLRHHAPAARARGPAAQPRHLERGRIADRATVLHRALRVPRRRAHRRRPGRPVHGGGGLRGTRRRISARALRQDPAGLGREPPAAVGCGRGRSRGATGPRLAALHGGLGQRVRGRRDLHPPGAGRRSRVRRVGAACLPRGARGSERRPGQRAGTRRHFARP